MRGEPGANATSSFDICAEASQTNVCCATPFSSGDEPPCNDAVATTPDGVILAAATYKERGKTAVSLARSGGGQLAQVAVWRSIDGVPFEKVDTVADTEEYTDRPGLGTGHVLIYRVCAPDGSVRSNEAQVSF